MYKAEQEIPQEFPVILKSDSLCFAPSCKQSITMTAQ